MHQRVLSRIIEYQVLSVELRVSRLQMHGPPNLLFESTDCSIRSSPWKLGGVDVQRKVAGAHPLVDLEEDPLEDMQRDPSTSTPAKFEDMQGTQLLPCFL